MILICSTENDESANQVIDWLKYYGVDWRRLDLTGFGNLIGIVSLFSKNSIACKISGKSGLLTSEDVSSVWIRRFTVPAQTIPESDIEMGTLFRIKSDFLKENRSIRNFLLSQICHGKIWINRIEDAELSKLAQLKCAHELNIQIPDTIVTSNKEDLIKFKKRYQNIIIKPIDSEGSYRLHKTSYTPLTTLVDSAFLDSLDDNFFPLLCQEYIEKEYEIRSFYLNEKFYSIAMFNKKKHENKIDVRDTHPGKLRKVPYLLPQEFEEKLSRMLRNLNLNCGTFDIIKSVSGGLYFLEVNPFGQYSMVSDAGNYYLDKLISQYLIKGPNEK